jgi:electron transfer flavoprotein alpha subunit
MKVLVFIELSEGIIKKSSLEAVCYGSQLAAEKGGECYALAIGEASETELASTGKFGAIKVLHASANGLEQENSAAYGKVITAAMKAISAEVLVAAKSPLADAVTARTAAALKAGIAGNVIALPDLSKGFVVKRSIFTGKAFAEMEITTAQKVILIKKNAIEVRETGNTAKVEPFEVAVDSRFFDVKTIEVTKSGGAVSLPEADIVVSGGRGMKGADHWQPLLDLAEALGAATACSKPVSDMDWRPHHEHVGQTGIKVSPNLYIACGISGAIQHLAGVNSSKVIVVINTDPEAPFFKAADYGIVGDVFEVLPKLTAAVKAL